MLNITQSRELQAALLALRQAQSDIRKDINADVRSQVNPVWQAALGERAHTRLEQNLIRGARVAVTTAGPIAQVNPRTLAGGLPLSDQWQAVEFGYSTKKQTITQTSRRGRKYQVTRMYGRNFKSRLSYRQGHVVFPAAGETATKVAAIWVRTIVDHFAKAFEVTRGN